SALAATPEGVWALPRDPGNSGSPAGVDTAWVMEPGSPAGVLAFADSPDSSQWAITRTALWRRDAAWQRVQTLDPGIGQPLDLALLAPDAIYLATDRGLVTLSGSPPGA